MPTIGLGFDYASHCALRRKAEAQVRAKFPLLIEGSSGWHRALANRLNRVR